jgi:hypothetical protein
MKHSWIYAGIVVCLILLAVVTVTAFARRQAAEPAAPITVDNTKMGSYRALAELSYQAFEKGDNAMAAVLARILERTWDKGEGDLRKSSPDTWSQIDSSMDGFIKPVMAYGSAAPDPRKVEAAYTTFLEKLKQAD